LEGDAVQGVVVQRDVWGPHSLHTAEGSPAAIPEEEYVPDAEAEPLVWAAVEGLYGDVHDIVQWLPGQPAEGFMAEVAARLQSMAATEMTP
jgi:hypothetical protein